MRITDTGRGDSYDEFADFVKNELGDIVSDQHATSGKKIRAYSFFWLWSWDYKTFDKMYKDVEMRYPDHATYEMDDGSLFVVDRTKQYEKIYNHRWNK